MNVLCTSALPTAGYQKVPRCGTGTSPPLPGFHDSDDLVPAISSRLKVLHSLLKRDAMNPDLRSEMHSLTLLMRRRLRSRYKMWARSLASTLTKNHASDRVFWTTWNLLCGRTSSAPPFMLKDGCPLPDQLTTANAIADSFERSSHLPPPPPSFTGPPADLHFPSDDWRLPEHTLPPFDPRCLTRPCTADEIKRLKLNAHSAAGHDGIPSSRILHLSCPRSSSTQSCSRH